jgi:hypothetical protein
VLDTIDSTEAGEKNNDNHGSDTVWWTERQWSNSEKKNRVNEKLR